MFLEETNLDERPILDVSRSRNPIHGGDAEPQHLERRYAAWRVLSANRRHLPSKLPKSSPSLTRRLAIFLLTPTLVRTRSRFETGALLPNFGSYHFCASSHRPLKCRQSLNFLAASSDKHSALTRAAHSSSVSLHLFQICIALSLFAGRSCCVSGPDASRAIRWKISSLLFALSFPALEIPIFKIPISFVSVFVSCPGSRSPFSHIQSCLSLPTSIAPSLRLSPYRS